MRLQDVCTVFLDGDWIESKDQSDKGIRLVQTGNIGEGLYLEKEERAKYVSEETFESLKCTEIYPGDILISRLPEPVGRACIIPPKKERMITAVDCTICRVDESIVSKEYLCYFMRSNAYYTKLLGSVTGTTRKRISRKNLGNIELEIPPKEEQTDVVSQLEGLMNVINSRNKELQLFDNLIKARFVEMFGNPVANDRGWNTLPLENACKSIVDCPHSTPSYTNEDTGFMCIRTSIVKKNKILWDDIEYIPEDEFVKRIQRKKPEVGDIVYTREGAILGIAAIIDRDCNVALGQRSMLLSPDIDKCTSEFVCVAMNSDSFLDNVLKGVSGSSSPHINVGDIKAFRMIMPPVELQKQFSDFVKQVDKSKVAVQKALDETQKLFDSLMQQYFG